MAPIRLLIVDDHTMFRQGLVSLLQGEAEFQVVGQAAGGQEALRLAGELQPDVVLMDVMMPEMGGVEATRRLLETTPHARILMLTVSEEDEDLLAAIQAGAEGTFSRTPTPMRSWRPSGGCTPAKPCSPRRLPCGCSRRCGRRLRRLPARSP
jgi:two-component system nitrate/nitrite response regulator NarL